MLHNRYGTNLVILEFVISIDSSTHLSSPSNHGDQHDIVWTNMGFVKCDGCVLRAIGLDI